MAAKTKYLFTWPIVCGCSYCISRWPTLLLDAWTKQKSRQQITASWSERGNKKREPTNTMIIRTAHIWSKWSEKRFRKCINTPRLCQSISPLSPHQHTSSHYSTQLNSTFIYTALHGYSKYLHFHLHNVWRTQDRVDRGCQEARHEGWSITLQFFSIYSKFLITSQAKSGNDPDFAKMVQAAADKVIAATAKESKGNGQKEKKK
jgi:hypothetical protein